MAEDPRLQASGEELAAKSRIAAALIERGALDIDKIDTDFSKHWMENPDTQTFQRARSTTV